MAHIPDGILSLPVLVVTGAAGIAGLAVGVRGLGDRDVPRAALMAAVFFLASSIAVPMGPSSVHLLLGGLIGLMLGWTTFPAIFVGLVLQALLFGFGGLTTLGADVVNMALPGALFAALARPWITADRRGRSIGVAAAVGGLSVLATAALVSLEIGLSDPAFVPSARLMSLVYLPLAGVEAVVTGFVAAFFLRVRPELIVRRPAEDRPS